MCAEVETPLPILPGYRADQARKSRLLSDIRSLAGCDLAGRVWELKLLVLFGAVVSSQSSLQV